jgi:hypothetical protein
MVAGERTVLVATIHAETGTPKVRAILAEPGADLFISQLASVEMLSAFAFKVRTGIFGGPDFTRLRGLFLAEVKRRLLKPARVLNAHHQLAGDLVGKHGLSRRRRTLDAPQLAVVLRIHRTAAIDQFVSADQRLCDIVIPEGLAAIDPELTH